MRQHVLIRYINLLYLSSPSLDLRCAPAILLCCIYSMNAGVDGWSLGSSRDTQIEAKNPGVLFCLHILWASLGLD